MNFSYEDLARAQIRERIDRADAERRGRHLAQARRRARKADRVVQAARLHRAHAVEPST